MGGGGSSSGDTYTPENFSASDIADFQKSSASEGYSQEQFDQLGNAEAVTKGPNAIGNVSWDGTQNTNIDQTFLSAFNRWRADQTNAKNSWQNYADKVQQQGDGTQTILGSAEGPTQTPYETILSAQAAINGSVGDPTKMTALQKAAQAKVGAP